MLWKCCTQYARKFGKLSSRHRTGKGQFSVQSLRKAMPKNAQTTTQLQSLHMLERLYSKSSKLGFSSMWTGLPDVHTEYRKGRGTRDQTAKIHWLIGKPRGFQKKSLLLLHWLCWSLWLCGSQQTGKFLKRWEYQTTLPASWKTCMQVKKQQLELDMEKWTGSKLGKEYIKAVYCHLAYLTSMQSTRGKCQAGWITSWNRDCWEKNQQPQICRWYHRKWRGPEEPLDERERGEWKSWLKTQC